MADEATPQTAEQAAENLVEVPESPTPQLHEDPTEGPAHHPTEEAQEAQEAVADLSDGEQQELASELNDAAESGASQEEMKQIIKKFTLKVNGKEVEKEIDLSDDEAVKRELQMGLAGRQSMQELAEIKKAYSQALEDLKSNPISVLEELGIDTVDLSTKRLQNQIEEDAKTPEQKAAEAAQKELEEYRKKFQKIEEDKKKQDDEMAVQKELETLYAEVDEAFEIKEFSRIPRTPQVMAKIANTLEWAENEVDEYGNKAFPDVKVKDIMGIVRDEYQQEIRGIINDAPIDFLEEFMGKQFFERIRQDKLEKYSKKTPNNNVPETAASIKKDKVESGNKKASDYKDLSYFDDLSKKFGM